MAKQANKNKQLQKKQQNIPDQSWQGRLKRLGKLLGLPLLIYFIFFCIFSWPWISHFSSQFFTDTGDGFQNVWNIWWINKSVTELHTSPWATNYLHYPYGTTLIGQTLNPFNGFVAIVLLKFMSLVQAYNLLVIFSFVTGGLTMFWLCYYFTRRYIPSLLGGFLFTFSSYHFAHAIGHMQLVSLEWIPLFILLWWKLMTKPRYRTALGAAIVLLLVLLCDYYYFLYSVVTAVAIAVYLWRKGSLPQLNKKQFYRPVLLFLVTSAIIVLPLPALLTLVNARDPLQGSHPARIFSTDLFGPFINGGFWEFSSLTSFYNRRIIGGVSETSVYLGVSTLVVVAIAFIKNRKIHKDMVFWLGLGLVFGILSLGPRLMVIGNSIERIPMPYAILEHIVPGLKLSGVPVRMMFMVTFAASIIVAMVLSKLDLKQTKGKLLIGLFAIVLAVELTPGNLPLTPATYPRYVHKLQQLPSGGVLDNAAASESVQLYNQTLTEKPMVLGYISRTPLSVQKKDNEFLSNMSKTGNYNKLCSAYKVRYFTTPASRPLQGYNFPVVYQDNEAIIYDLKNAPNC